MAPKASITGVRTVTLKSGDETIARLKVNLENGKVSFHHVNCKMYMNEDTVTFKDLPIKEISIEL